MNYADVVKRLLLEYADRYSIEGENPLRPLFDDANQSYLLLDSNWLGKEYVHHTPIHVDIIDGKIWVQYDDTEDGFASDLLEAGVPAADIVLGFRPPELRPFTEFAIA